MSIIYPKKAKTQGHLREIILSDYRSIKNSVVVGEKYRVSHTTVLKWNKRCNKEGSLENKSSAPIIPSRKHDFRKLVLIHYLYKKENETIDQIEESLERQGEKMPRSTIGYYLKNWGLVEERKQQGKRLNQKFKKYEPGFVHIDITYGPKIDGIKYYIFVAIDRATRCMYYEVHTNKKSNTTSKFLENVLNFFPFKITKILTDNGKEFTLKNHQGKDNPDLIGAFDFVCNTYGVEHRTTKPYTPQTNGMVEKVNDIIKSNTVKIHKYNNAGEMIDDLNSFLINYILFRKHSSLRSEINVKTPFEAIEYWYNLSPELFKENPVDFKKRVLTIKMNL